MCVIFSLSLRANWRHILLIKPLFFFFSKQRNRSSQSKIQWTQIRLSNPNSIVILTQTHLLPSFQTRQSTYCSHSCSIVLTVSNLTTFVPLTFKFDCLHHSHILIATINLIAYVNLFVSTIINRSCCWTTHYCDNLMFFFICLLIYLLMLLDNFRFLSHTCLMV